MAMSFRRMGVAAVAAFAMIGLSGCQDSAGSLTEENISQRVSEAFIEAGTYRFEFSAESDGVYRAQGAVSYDDGEIVALHLVEQSEQSHPQEYRYVDGELYRAANSGEFRTEDDEEIEQVLGAWDLAALYASGEIVSMEEVQQTESGGVEVTEFVVEGSFDSGDLVELTWSIDDEDRLRLEDGPGFTTVLSGYGTDVPVTVPPIVDGEPVSAAQQAGENPGSLDGVDPMTTDDLIERISAAYREAGSYTFTWTSSDEATHEGAISYADDGEVEAFWLREYAPAPDGSIVADQRLIDGTLHHGAPNPGSIDDSDAIDELVGNWDFGRSQEWYDTPESVEALGEEEVDGVPTQRYEVTFADYSEEWWIDAADMVRRIEAPLLDSDGNAVGSTGGGVANVGQDIVLEVPLGSDG